MRLTPYPPAKQNKAKIDEMFSSRTLNSTTSTAMAGGGVGNTAAAAAAASAAARELHILATSRTIWSSRSSDWRSSGWTTTMKRVELTSLSDRLQGPPGCRAHPSPRGSSSSTSLHLLLLPLPPQPPVYKKYGDEKKSFLRPARIEHATLR